MELGARFWLALIERVIACGIAGFVLFLLIETAWYRWGLLGMFLALSACLLIFGVIYDRRQARRYDDALET